MNSFSIRRTCVSGCGAEPELLAARRLFLRGVLPGHKPTVTITLQTAAPTRILAPRTQRIVV